MSSGKTLSAGRQICYLHLSKRSSSPWPECNSHLLSLPCELWMGRQSWASTSKASLLRNWVMNLRSLHLPAQNFGEDVRSWFWICYQRRRPKFSNRNAWNFEQSKFSTHCFSPVRLVRFVSPLHFHLTPCFVSHSYCSTKQSFKKRVETTVKLHNYWNHESSVWRQ